MGSQQNPTSSDRTRAHWSPTMERYFIDLMLDQMHRGNRSGHTFSKQAWTDMLTMFNRQFGCKCDRDALKTHYSILWKQYDDMKNLLDQDGFSWDDTHKMVVADARVWEAYIEAQPGAQIYRGKAMPTFSDLCLIYAYTKADGRYSRSSHDIDFDDDIQELITGAGTSSIAPVTTEHGKPDWMTAMDQYFVELMLVQIKRGNRSDSTFSKQAWKDMLTSFNSKFGSKYGKGFLKHRYKKVWKYYTDVQSLLKQNGFSWDQKRRVIVADDDTWDNYVKVYPDARLYRNQTLLDFRDLELIYENAAYQIPSRRVCHDKNLEDIILPKKQSKEKVGHFSAENEFQEVCWTSIMDRYLTDLLLDQALRGNKIGHTFTDEAWTEMVTMFVRKFGASYDTDVLKHRFRYLRKRYNDINIILKQTGFYWDDAQEIVAAEDYTWDSYIKEHPEAQLYKNKCVPSYHKLCVIFDQENSSRRCGELNDADLGSGGPDHMNGQEAESPAQGDYVREYWTQPMDRHFIDIMLQQVHQGNRIGSSFNDTAWIHMSLSFVDRFGLSYDRDLLKSRHKHLGKLYNDLKNLLNQRGFSWDEKWQMVTAYTDVWNVYFKEYPDAKSYRGKCNPNLNDLCLIYGDPTSCGRGSQKAESIICNRNGRAVRNGYLQRTDWTPEMDRYFIDLMLEQVRQGNMARHNFNKESWYYMAAKFISQFGSQHDQDVLKSRYIILRKTFNDVKSLVERTGFAWDEAKNMVIAGKPHWDTYIKEHPDARSYRNRSLPSYDDLFLIYGNPKADGLEHHSCLSTDSEHSAFGIRIGKEHDKSATNSDSPGIKWTFSMENYFIDLMLEQVRWGNKIDHTFTDQGWSWMIHAFSEKFGLICTKNVLENQYRRMMLEYNNIMGLLNQDGFAWDGFQQMVIADDDVWEDCIEEHPEAINYKDRSLNTYEDLCMIFGNKAATSSLETEINNDLDTSLDGILGDLQWPGSGFEMPNLRKRRKSATFSSLSDSHRKIRRPKKHEDYGLIESVVDALQAIPGMNDELFLEACRLLEDEKQAKKFMAMDVGKRIKWLLRKLRM